MGRVLAGSIIRNPGLIDRPGENSPGRRPVCRVRRAPDTAGRWGDTFLVRCLPAAPDASPIASHHESQKFGEHSLQPLPRGHVLRQFAERLECLFKIAAVKPITIPPSNTDGIEHILVAAGKYLEKNQILRGRKWEANAEEFVMVGPFKRDLLERERSCDQIELKMSSPKSQCSRRQQSFLLDRFVQLKASRSRSGDQRLRLGSRQKDDGISIGSCPRLTHRHDSKPTNDEIPHTFPLEKRERKPAEAVELTCRHAIGSPLPRTTRCGEIPSDTARLCG